MMRKNIPIAHQGRCTFFLLAALGHATAAQAQDEIDYGRLLGIAEAQSTVTQRMSTEILFVSLGIDREISLEQLQSSRDEFDRALAGFRDGDSDLQMSAIFDPELLGYIEEAERHWAPMEVAIGECLSGATVTAAHVDAIADASESLQDAFVDLADGLRERSKAGASHSMLGVALETAGRTTLLSQQMTKEFLLVAFGHQPGRNRSALRETAENFENGLNGLLEGDISHLLLAAPTPEIRAQLHSVEQIWMNDYRPLIERAISEGELNVGAAARMSRVNANMLREIELATELYRGL